MTPPAAIVAEYSERDREEWAAYADARADASLFHDLRWSDAVQSAYRFRPRHLLARRGGAIVGVLPLVYVASPLLGRSLISAAFGVGGGLLADDAEAAEALGARALEMGRELGVNYVELRGGPPPGEGYGEKTGLYASFERELPTDAASLLQFLPRKRRAEVRKAIEAEERGEIRLRTDGGVGDFYRAYAESLRGLGTPVMPRKFLDALKAGFGAGAEISLVEAEGDIVAGLFTFWRRDRVMPYYVGAGPKARELRAFDALYHSLMRRAIERGVRVFDFGRSKAGSTHYETKTYWGFEPAPLSYHVGLVRAKELPNVSPNNPKFARFVSAWRRLPLPVANALGPIVARNFP